MVISTECITQYPSFGSRQSLIGLQTSSSIEGPWTDEGVVIQTRAEDSLNAIDANVLTDADGRMWMVYGSFWWNSYH